MSKHIKSANGLFTGTRFPPGMEFRVPGPWGEGLNPPKGE